MLRRCWKTLGVLTLNRLRSLCSWKVSGAAPTPFKIVFAYTFSIFRFCNVYGRAAFFAKSSRWSSFLGGIGEDIIRGYKDLQGTRKQLNRTTYIVASKIVWMWKQHDVRWIAARNETEIPGGFTIKAHISAEIWPVLFPFHFELQKWWQHLKAGVFWSWAFLLRVPAFFLWKFFVNSLLSLQLQELKTYWGRSISFLIEGAEVSASLVGTYGTMFNWI